MKLSPRHYILVAFLQYLTNQATGQATPYFFNSSGLVINSDSCTAQYCKLCDPGQYNAGCGLDAAKIVGDTCTPCASPNNPPSNGVWTAFLTISSNVFVSGTQVCPFTCNTGYQKNAGNTACVASACPLIDAKFFPTATQTPCTYVCSAGYYASGTGALGPTDCLQCPQGSWSAQGASACTPCGVGNYNPSSTPSTSDAVCQVCPRGTWSATPSASSCSACSIGYYSGSEGSTVNSCAQCLAGTYAASTGQSSCTACPQGTFSTVPGGSALTSCSDCPAGTYAASTGSQLCTDCAAGTSSSATKKTTDCSSNLCLPGSYSLARASACTPCPTGTAQSASGASVCPACTNKQYYVGTGGVNCDNCAGCGVGRWKRDCGGSNPGTCDTCSQPTVIN